MRKETFRGSGTSLPPVGNEIFCSNRRYIIPTYSAYCNKLSSTVVSTFAWHVRGPRFDPRLGKIIICIFFISCSFSRELNCNNCLLDNT